jgi:hypothetical protein
MPSSVRLARSPRCAVRTANRPSRQPAPAPVPAPAKILCTLRHVTRRRVGTYGYKGSSVAGSDLLLLGDEEPANQICKDLRSRQQEGQHEKQPDEVARKPEAVRNTRADARHDSAVAWPHQSRSCRHVVHI